LEEKMNQFAEEMRFEEAAVMRNKLALLREYSEKQKIVSAEAIDRDIFAIARVDENACAIALKVRDGKLTGKRHFIIKNAEIDDDATILQRTLEKWYLENDFVPREIFLPDEPEDLEYLLGWLAGKRGGPVNIKIPRIGEKRHMVEMAETNARFILKERQIAIDRREQSLPHAVTALQRDLRLPNPPRRIECIDNSHIQGSDMVSSLVVFEEGKPKKADYRKFKIKSVEKGDDFAAMREVVNRRYSRLIAEEQPLPDLIVIDGGKGQLSAAYGVLKELAIEGKVPVVGLAKRLEEVFFPGEKEPYLLPRTSSSLRLIQQLRDEAHRFAIAFHRQLRDKRTLRTELTNIPGIGEKTAQKLLINLNSVEEIRNAGLEKLREFVNLKQAEAIRKYFDQASGENFEVID
ncbi:MAG: excinuclease ABC subunit UvrC, partial [Candidatus Kapaibacterium sp.]